MQGGSWSIPKGTQRPLGRPERYAEPPGSPQKTQGGAWDAMKGTERSKVMRCKHAKAASAWSPQSVPKDPKSPKQRSPWGGDGTERHRRALWGHERHKKANMGEQKGTGKWLGSTKRPLGCPEMCKDHSGVLVRSQLGQESVPACACKAPERPMVLLAMPWLPCCPWAQC